MTIRAGWAVVMVAATVLLASSEASAAFKQTAPRKLKAGEIAVDKPGSYAKAGKTYVLTKDVKSATSGIYLGKDVILDLNGYTLTYAAGKYEHVPNYGFEEGLKGWDTSKAAGAKVVSSSVRPMVGEKILELPAGQELVSSYITLPVANRPYYAMCAVATKDMRVSIYVEDEKGNPVKCTFNFGGGRNTCPEKNRSPKLGGGVVFALLFNQPAGKYRIRVKAEGKKCLIDEVDIRPALDTGIGIVGKIHPWAYYKCVLDGDSTAFFSLYGKEKKLGIPIVKGSGTVTIKNGVIKSGFKGVRSLGILGNAKDVLVKLENVKIVASGINTNAVNLAKADIRNCRFEIDTPFIINRHDQRASSVSVDQAIEVAHSEFIGGQGNLRLAGSNAKVHDNLFVNNQTVTNHYSISSGGTGNKIYNNRFEPKQGSGIYFGGTNNELYGNTFKIMSAPPNCEYRYSDWSTNAIRMSDYNRPRGKGVSGNRVYKNKIYITGKAYPQYKGYTPATYAVHYSCGGGTNYIYENEVYVDLKDKGSNVSTTAFFVGGGKNSGGEWYSNTITANVPHVWVGARYGSACFDKFYNNVFIRAKDAPAGMKPIRMGWWKNTAREMEFYSNVCKGFDFQIDATPKDHAYVVGWTLTVAVSDKGGKPVKAARVIVADTAGKEVASAQTDSKGHYVVRLPEYRMAGNKKTVVSSYVIKVGDKSKAVNLTEDMQLTIQQ